MATTKIEVGDDSVMAGVYLVNGEDAGQTLIQVDEYLHTKVKPKTNITVTYTAPDGTTVPLEKGVSVERAIETLAESMDTVSTYRRMLSAMTQAFGVTHLKAFMVTAVFQDKGITGDTIETPFREDFTDQDAMMLHAAAGAQVEEYGRTLLKRGTLLPENQIVGADGQPTNK